MQIPKALLPAGSEASHSAILVYQQQYCTNALVAHDINTKNNFKNSVARNNTR